MHCIDSNTLVFLEIPKTNGATISKLSPDDEKDFMVRRIRLEEGGSMPYHTNEIQHQQFVLKGEADVKIGETIHHAKEGDFLYIPAGIAHSYSACHDIDYEFLCMITTKDDSIVML